MVFDSKYITKIIIIIYFFYIELKSSIFVDRQTKTKIESLKNINNKNNSKTQIIHEKKELFKDYYKIKDFIKNVRFNTFKNQLIHNITYIPKISIIIPVYNGEKYIKTALFSIQYQDFKDIQII